MAIIDKLLGRNKTLSDLSPVELRKEEILIGKQRERLLKKVEDAAAAKQRLFKQGTDTKSPEVRKALAQDFEMKTREQLMTSRELGIRGKELLTVSRLRMMKENVGNSSALGRLKVTDRDVARITSMIEDQSVTEDVYLDRLDEILDLGEQSDRDMLGSRGLSQAGQELMQMWENLDAGKADASTAFDQADAAIRKRQASGENAL